MQFKEIKPNYIVYAFNKSNMTCNESKVVSVSQPRFDNKVGQQPCMVVDITLETDSSNTTYVFPDSASKAYTDNIMFCIDKNDVISDIKSILHADEQYIADLGKKREEITKCHQLLAELDTEEKAKQEMEHRLSSIESRFDSIESLLKQIATNSSH